MPLKRISSTRNRASGSGSAPPVETGGADALTSDETLVARALAGSHAAYDEIVRRHQGRLFGYLRRFIADAGDAEDITQETFLRAWQRLHQYRSQYRFTTWLFTIGHRLAINHMRRAKRVAVYQSDSQLVARTNASNLPAPDSRAMAAESHAGVWAIATEVLSSIELEVMWLRYAEDLSAGEIAHVTGRTTVGVRVMLHRARQRLANRLDEGKAEAETTRADASTPLQIESPRPLWQDNP